MTEQSPDRGTVRTQGDRFEVHDGAHWLTVHESELGAALLAYIKAEQTTTEAPITFTVREGSGIWYAGREGRMFNLSYEPTFQLDKLDRPDRDVAAALLRYALDRLEGKA